MTPPLTPTTMLMHVTTLLSLLATTHALDNGLALTPPMGYRTWEQLSINVNANVMRSTMNALALPRKSLDGKSLVDLGYTNVGLDDGWQPRYSTPADAPGINGGFHDAHGMPIVDNITFPGGFQPLAEHAKSLGQTFSFYTNNCGDGQSPPENNYTNPQQIAQHYWGDVHATQLWGLHGFKVDGCGQFNNMSLYAALANNTGVPMLFESCHPLNIKPNSPNAPSVDPHTGALHCPYHYFRTSADVSFSFDSVLGNVNTVSSWSNVSRPSCWAHPDMLEVGNLWTYEEDRTNFALHCISSSPLILSFDLSDETAVESVLPIIGNQELIDMNQQFHFNDPGHLIRSYISEDTSKYVNAVVCNETMEPGINGWSFRDVSSSLSSSLTTTVRTIQVVAPGGEDCLDLIIQAPLRVTKCNSSVDTQILKYDPTTKHLGKKHPMQDGTGFGYVNVGSKKGPLVQFTRSYGVNQCNEEYLLDDRTGQLSTACDDDGTSPHHDVAPKRCIRIVAAKDQADVDNNSERLVRNVTHQLWAKPLRNGTIAVLVVNRNVESLSYELKFSDVVGSSGSSGSGDSDSRRTLSYHVRDVYEKKNVGIHADVYVTRPITPHDSVMLVLSLS